jgi:hypothetical protein
MPMLQIEVDDELLFKLGELKNRFRVKTWKQFAAFIGNNAVWEENRVSYWTNKNEESPLARA